MRTVGALVALATCVLVALSASGAAAKDAAAPACVSFLVTFTISPDGAGGSGTYTRIGSIPGGRSTDRAELVSERPFRVRVERTLDPGRRGGPTIQMRLNVRGTAMNTGSPPHNEARGTWSIVSGSGPYASLRGSGQLVALAVPSARGLKSLEALVGCISR